MSNFSFEKTVNANRDTVFDVFSNYENFQNQNPQHFPSIRVRSVRDNVAVVEEHMNLGDRELVIMAKHVSNKPVSHDVYVIGGDAKGTHIEEQFVEIPDGTKVIINVDLKLSGKMKISSMFGKKYKQDYEQLINDFVKTAEN